MVYVGTTEVETPGMTEEYDVQSFLNADFMSKESAAMYRRTAAKLNYLALDNPLIAFASEEASRSMRRTKTRRRSDIEEDIENPAKETTTTCLYEWQDHPGELTGYTDSDWAGCKLTRRSTSGGVILHGSHLLLHYSRTQAGVALSSAEAELNAALKMDCEILGILNSAGSSEMTWRSRSTVILLRSKPSWRAVDAGK